MATPTVLTFDAEGRPVKFETWLDDLHLFLQLTARRTFHFTRLPDSLRTVRDHFLSRSPTELTIALLEKELLAAEASIVAVGTSRGDPRTPFFEGCSPSPLLPSVASAAAVDLLGAEKVGTASASSGRRKSKGGRVEVEEEEVGVEAVGVEERLGRLVGSGGCGEGAQYLRVPPDPGIQTSPAAALGASESAAPGPGEAAALGASESVPAGTESTAALHTFTLDSGTLSGLYLPSFSTNLVAGSALQDRGVHQFTPAYERVTHCTCARTGRHLATFTRQPGSDLYTLTTASPQVAASASASASGQLSAPCSCRSLAHETVLWHHRLGHPSVQRLRAMHKRDLVAGLPRVLPPLPPSPAPPCLPCVEGWQRAAPHSSSFPDDCSLTDAPHGRVGPSPRPWSGSRLQLSERFRSDFPVLRLHSDRGGEFSSGLLRAFCQQEGIEQSFTLPASPQHNGVAERRIGLVMEVAHFFDTALDGRGWRCVAFSGLGMSSFVRDTSADKLSRRAVPCVFLGFVPDAPGWQFYHATSRRVLASQDVTFDESVPYYRLFPYRTAPLPPRLSSSLQVDPVEPVEVAVDSRPAGGAGLTSGGAEPGGAASGGAASGGAEPGGAEPDRAESGGAEPGGAEPGGAESGGAEPGGAAVWGCCIWSLRSGAPGAADPGGGAATGTEDLRGGATAAVEDPGVGAAAGAEDPSGGASAGAEDPGVGAAAGAEDLGGGAAAGAEDLGVGAAAGAEDPDVGATAGAEDPALGVSAGSGDAARPRPHSYRLPRLSLLPLLTLVPREVLRSVRVPLPSPPASSLPTLPDPESDSRRAASPTVTRLLATVVTDPTFESSAASALVAELVDFAARCRLDYAASLVAESASESVCPPSVVGECALGTASLRTEGRSSSALLLFCPSLVSLLVAPEGDPDAPDIPTPRTYAEAMAGPYSSQWQTAMDAETVPGSPQAPTSTRFPHLGRTSSVACGFSG
ncbi:unnamed protein product [Closterium sp. Yama58-4]|nr:unnamed protein product [Closterium sp. Yama58-4]